MLPKHQRLVNGRDFKRVYQKGSFFSAPLFSLNWLINKTRNTRVGVVVGKKISTKATERNSIKRKYREIIRKIYLDIPTGFDVIIVIKEKSKIVDFAEIERTIIEGIKNIK